MYDLAKKARAGMKSKAERLAGEKDRKTDSSDWSPAEPLNADVKTGMRPVSRRAYKDGGKVAGSAPKGRADRKPRKAGGKVEEKGEQPMVDRYVNRDLKKANEYRDGKKHVGGLKHGGRAHKALGGEPPAEKVDMKFRSGKKPGVEFNKPYPVPTPRARPANLTPAANNKIKPDPSKYLPGDVITGPPKEIRKDGGRMKRADGGSTKKSAWNMSAAEMLESSRKRQEDVKKGVEESKKKYPGMSAIERAEQSIKDKFTPAYFANLKKEKEKEKDSDEGYKEFADRRAKRDSDADEKRNGGRAKKADGGPMMMDPRLGIVKPKAMEFGQNVVTPGLKRGGRAEKAKGGSFWGSKEFQSAFRDARKAFLAGEGPKNFEFKGKQYSTDLLKIPTPPERPRPVQQKIIDVQFGPPKGEMPKTDQMNNPNPGMKKGGRVAKQIGGALGRAANALGRGMAPAAMGSAMRPQMPSQAMMGRPPIGANPAMIGRGPAPQAMANAQGRPFQPGGRFAPPPSPSSPLPPMTGTASPLTQTGAMSNLAGMQPYAAPLPSQTYTGPMPTLSQTGPLPGSQYFGGLTTQAPTYRDASGNIVPSNQVTGLQTQSIGSQPVYMGPNGPVTLDTSSSSLQQLAGRTPITSGLSSTPLTQEALMRQAQLATMSPQDQFAFNAQQAAASGNPYPAGASFESSLGPQGITVPMTYANGGRIARAYGGETTTKSKGKSGKTNINIVIATGKQQQPQSMVPDVNAAPMGPQGIPVPTPAPTAPMGVPPVPAAPMMGGPAPSGPMTPPSPMMPPMPRKAGGRVSKVAKSFKDMTAGAGSGEGRLQKADIAKRAPHKAGGKVYRSYKDMDAGAGSGKGRLEKTEIQTRKK